MNKMTKQSSASLAGENFEVVFAVNEMHFAPLLMTQYAEHGLRNHPATQGQRYFFKIMNGPGETFNRFISGRRFTRKNGRGRGPAGGNVRDQEKDASDDRLNPSRDRGWAHVSARTRLLNRFGQVFAKLSQRPSARMGRERPRTGQSPSQGDQLLQCLHDA